MEFSSRLKGLHPMLEIDVTVSQVLDYWKCPSYHWYYHVLKRGKEEYKGPADLGTLAHSRLEDFMKILQRYDMKPPEEVMVPLVNHWNLHDELVSDYAEKNVELKAKDLSAATALEYRLGWWFANGEWQRWDEILMIEKPLRLSLGDFLTTDGSLVTVFLNSKPDVFVVWNDKIWHVQWKTHSKNFANLALLVESSMHEASFRMQVERNPAFKLPFGGTLLGAFDKDALHMQKKGAKCAHCGRAGYEVKPAAPFVKMAYLPSDDGFVVDAEAAIVEAALGIADQMAFQNTYKHDVVKMGQARWLRNLGSCSDIFKQRLCQYREGVCQRRASIMDGFQYNDVDPQSHYREKTSE